MFLSSQFDYPHTQIRIILFHGVRISIPNLELFRNRALMGLSQICHPHTQIRIILFDGVRRDIPKWKLSPNRASIGLSQIAFLIIVLPKDDRTNSFQEERLGLRYWTMI